MRNTIKRTVAMLLFVVMLLSMLPSQALTAFASEADTGGTVSSDVGIPAENTEPTGSTVPTDATVAADGTDPTEPDSDGSVSAADDTDAAVAPDAGSDPADSPNDAAPADPTEATEPSAATDPVYNANVTEPANSTEPTDATTPTEPAVEATEPIVPAEPEEVYTRMEAETDANLNLYSEDPIADENASEKAYIGGQQIETVFQLELYEDLATANLETTPYVKFNVEAGNADTYEFHIGVLLENLADFENIEDFYIPVVVNKEVYKAICDVFTADGYKVQDTFYEFTVELDLIEGKNEIFCIATDADLYLIQVSNSISTLSDVRVNFDYLDIPEELIALEKDDEPVDPESEPATDDALADTTEPADPVADAAEPTEPSEEATAPSDPSEAATEPTDPTEDVTEPTEPSEEVTDPTEPSEGATEPSEPAEEVTDPTEPSEDATEPTDPAVDVTEPSVADPTEEATEPTDETTLPVEDIISGSAGGIATYAAGNEENSETGDAEQGTLKPIGGKVNYEGNLIGNMYYSAAGVTMQIVLTPYGESYTRNMVYGNILDIVKNYKAINVTSGTVGTTVYDGVSITPYTYIADPATGRVYRLPDIDCANKSCVILPFDDLGKSGQGAAGLNGYSMSPVQQDCVSGPATISTINGKLTVTMPTMNAVEKFMQRIIMGNQYGSWNDSSVAKSSSGGLAMSASEDVSLYVQVLRELDCPEEYIENYVKSYSDQLSKTEDADVLIPSIIWSYVVAECSYSNQGYGTGIDYSYDGKTTADHVEYWYVDPEAYCCDGSSYQDEISDSSVKGWHGSVSERAYDDAVSYGFVMQILTVKDVAYTSFINNNKANSSTVYISAEKAAQMADEWWLTAFDSTTSVVTAFNDYTNTGYKAKDCLCVAEFSHSCKYVLGLSHTSGNSSYHDFHHQNVCARYFARHFAGTGYVNYIYSGGPGATDSNVYYYRGFWTPFGERKEGTLTVSKQISPSGSNTAANLTGWRFELYATKADAEAYTNPLDYTYTDSTGTATFAGLLAGRTYYLREAPPNRQDRWSNAAGWTIDLDYWSATVVENMVTNVGTAVNSKSGNLSVQKAISGNSTAANLQNWRIELYDTKAKADAGGTNYIAHAYTDSTGKVTFSGLSAGTTYYAREAPAARQDKRTDLTGWTLTPTVLSKAVVAGTTTSMGTITNTQRGRIQARKGVTGAAATAANLSGWVINVYSNAACTTYVTSITTNDTGYGTSGYLKPGTYYVKESPNQTRTDAALWQLDSSVITVTVTAGNTVNAFQSGGYTAVNSLGKEIHISKSPSCSDTVFSQIENNSLYSLAGAQYQILVGGVVQETITTDANGDAVSAKQYAAGTTGIIKEVKAPAGYKLNSTEYSFTVPSTAGNYVVEVEDEPVFDPGRFTFQKENTSTGTAMGNTSYEGAIFKWEYYANNNWSGTPTKTWYFQTNSRGYYGYNATYLLDNASYNSDALFISPDGDCELPLGSVKITEVVAPAGYTTMEVLYASVIQSASGGAASFAWTDASKQYIKEDAAGTFVGEEPIDTTTFGSLAVQKLDALTGNAVQGDVPNLIAKFKVINRSSNSVKVGSFAVADPGDVCYEFETDASGYWASAADLFPIGSYEVIEVTPPTGMLLNSTWSQSFTITADKQNFSFTTADLACKNDVIRGGVSVQKLDILLGENTGKDALLDGITFSVVSLNDNPVVVNGVTYSKNDVVATMPLAWNDAEGKWVAQLAGNTLPYGTYKVIENPMEPGSQYANEHYTLSTAAFTFRIRENGQIVTADINGNDMLFENLPLARIEIHKINALNQSLAGAKFSLEWSADDGATWNPIVSVSAGVFQAGGTTTQGVTDGWLLTGSNGIIAFEGLDPTLKYRVTELEAPEGYIPLADYAYVGYLSADTTELVLTVVNSRGYILPESGVLDNGALVTGGALLAGVALLLAVILAITYLPVFHSKKQIAINKTINTNKKGKKIMKKTMFTRLLSLVMCLCMLGSLATTAFAAEIADATVNMDAKCKLTIYKYDFTNAAKDGVWTEESYVSTGQYDADVNEQLGTDAVRKGDTDGTSNLGNGQKSNGYAIKGVEYSYLKVADFYQFSESEKDGGATQSRIQFLYKFDKTKAADLLAAIGLADGLNSDANANALDDTAWFYQSDVLNAALKASLAANSTTVKNALEAYVSANNGTAMPLTDENGRTIATGLEVGLYLLVETKVPEMVTSTTDPFFVSLPMTNVDGGSKEDNYLTVNDGGHKWLYDVTIYPKNTTGLVTLEKTVREAQKDTGKNNASAIITDGFGHYATASAGDTVEYQIISTLPTITSNATAIAEYTFQDVLSRGLSYDSKTPVVIEWFTDADCTDKVATWNVADGKFTVSKSENGDGSHTMTIAMTEAGLAEINTANTNDANANNKGNAADGEHLYAGYSNYTMRITYAAIVNSDESVVYGDEGNENDVVLLWRRTSSEYKDTLIDDAHIYTYGINLTKEFSDGKTDQELFNHVLFKVQNKADGYYITAALNEEEGVWYVTGHTDQESAATAIHPVTWEGKPGQIVLKGVEDDEYILTEIETADTYTLLKENISVVITATDDATRPCEVYEEDALGLIQNDPRFNFDGGLDLSLNLIPQEQLAHNMLTASAVVDGNAVTMLNDEVDTESTNALVPLLVINNHGVILPQTGEIIAVWMARLGPSIILVPIVGLFFFIFLLPKKKENENEAQ